MATQQPLTRFSGDPDDPVQPATFLQDFEVRMTELMTPRADLASRIKPYLERDSRAWEWYTEDLTATDRTGSWEGFEAKFHLRFPSQKKEKKSAKSYLTSLEAERITHEQMMTTSEDTNQPYHQWWADRLLRLAKGAEVEKTKQSIGTVWKSLPYALKKTVEEEHDTWMEFTEAIKKVKWSVLKVEAEHEASKAVPMAPPETPRAKLATSFAAARISTPSSPSPSRARPAYATNPGARRPRRLFTALDELQKGTLRRGIAAKIQHPTTPEGIAAWKAELLEWASRHGVDGALSEITIVPLKPGTEAVCSGECFKCGNPRHGFEVPCPRPGTIPPVESDWRAYCQRELGGKPARVNAVQLVGPEAIFEGMVDSGNGEGLTF
ncbi:retrotransposon-like family member (retr-1) partial [Lentinula edodes]|uniref:Retrotransposon-like family member (Retr-1) partial n=1 Tax=Lentinula edodes TaxID=5353 RepID=A0A1Q3E7N0_LENED|nr:retrotransposon-like family member (retr-1) partial [Lentinula edodes]